MEHQDDFRLAESPPSPKPTRRLPSNLSSMDSTVSLEYDYADMNMALTGAQPTPVEALLEPRPTVRSPHVDPQSIQPGSSDTILSSTPGYDVPQDIMLSQSQLQGEDRAYDNLATPEHETGSGEPVYVPEAAKPSHIPLYQETDLSHGEHGYQENRELTTASYAQVNTESPSPLYEETDLTNGSSGSRDDEDVDSLGIPLNSPMMRSRKRTDPTPQYEHPPEYTMDSETFVEIDTNSVPFTSREYSSTDSSNGPRQFNSTVLQDDGFARVVQLDNSKAIEMEDLPKSFEDSEGPDLYSRVSKQERKASTYKKMTGVFNKFSEAIQTVEEVSSWKSEFGRKVIKRTCITGCGPCMLVLLVTLIPIAIAAHYVLLDEITLDMRLTSFTIPDHPAVLVSDAKSATIPYCIEAHQCLDQKCPEGSRRRREDDTGPIFGNHKYGNEGQGLDVLSIRGGKVDMQATSTLYKFLQPWLPKYEGDQSFKADTETPESESMNEFLTNNYYKDMSWSNQTEGQTRRRRALSTCSTSSSSSFDLTLVYEGLRDGNNMLSNRSLKEMRDSEAVLARFAFSRTGSWPQDECFKTITRYLYADAHGSTDVPVLSEGQVTEAFNYAAGAVSQPGRPDPLGQELYTYMSSDLQLPSTDQQFWSATYVRAEMIVQERLTDSAIEAWIDELENQDLDGVRLIYVQSDIFTYQILQMLKDDVYWAIWALTFVATYMLFHTGSLFITLTGVFNLLLSVPLAYGLYREVFLRQHLSLLTPVTLLVIIGIAVDDVFVFVDMFKQAHPSLDLVGRMTRTMLTASRSTLFTTVTSALAFASNTVSEIPALANFGLFTALVILMNYLVLICLVPVALCFWWRFVYPIEVAIANVFIACFPCCKPKKIIGNRSIEGNKEHPPVPMHSSNPMHSSAMSDVGSGPEVPSNPITEQPIYANTGGFRPLKERRFSDQVIQEEAEDEGKLSWMQKALSLLAFIVVTKKWRRVVLGVYFILMILFISQTAQLQAADKPPSIVSPDSNAGRAEALESEFSDFSATSGSDDLPDIVGRYERKIPDEIQEELDDDDYVPPTFTCADQAGFIVCGSGFRLSAIPSEITCADVACTAAECCVRDFVCSDFAESQCTSDGKIYITNPALQTCDTDCTTQDCCVDMTCNQFTSLSTLCPSGFHVKPSPASNTCADLDCTASECCDPNPTCAEDTPNCGDFKELTADPDNITCGGDSCTVQECCVNTPTCQEFSASFGTDWASTCNSDTLVPLIDLDTSCRDSTCTVDDCCTPLTCSLDVALNSFACDLGSSFRNNIETRVCAGLACGQSECCQGNPVCSSSPDICGAGTHQDPAVANDVCSSATCNVLECPCIANPNCTSFTCNPGSTHLTADIAAPCESSVCTASDCCDPNPTCSTVTQAMCGEGQVLVSNRDQITCATDTCDITECCRPLICSDADCGATFTIAALTTDDECLQDPCERDQCCELKSSILCSETQEDFPAFCGAGSVFDETKLGDTCASSPCEYDDCCLLSVNPDCSSLSECGNNRHFKDNPDTITCSDDPCTVQECCDFNPRCTEDPVLCSTGFVEILNPNQRCASENCTETDCCRQMTCDIWSSEDGNTCPTQTTLRNNPGSISCQASTCTVDECCLENPSCFSTQQGNPNFCSGNQIFDDSKTSETPAWVCATSECLVSECCEQVETAGVSLVGDCSELTSTQIEDLRQELKQQIIDDVGGGLEPDDIVLDICGVPGRKRSRRQSTIDVSIQIKADSADDAVVQVLEQYDPNIPVDIIEVANNGDVYLDESVDLVITTSTTTRTTQTATTTTRTVTTVTFTTAIPAETDEIRNSPNTEVHIIFGLLPPFVNRSLVTLDFIPDTRDFKPIFDLEFFASGDTKLQARNVICPLIAANTDLVLEGQQFVCATLDGMEVALRNVECGNDGTEELPIYLSLPFKTVFTSQVSSYEVKRYYEKWEKFLDELREEYPVFVNMQQHNDAYVNAINEVIAIRGAIWGIVTALLLCLVCVTIFKARISLILITMFIIFANVLTVLAVFRMNGWKLGGIEAVSLSILVGTCVDYVIHMLEGYLEADPDHVAGKRSESVKELAEDMSDAHIREWRMRSALSTVGVPILSSAITTAGSAMFLTFASLIVFRRFGQIVVINTVASITLTLTLLPPMLAEFGPVEWHGSLRTTFYSIVGLGLFFASIALVMFIAATQGAYVEGPNGAPLFE